MSKRADKTMAPEVKESICNAIDFLAWLLEDAEEDGCEDMLECAERYGVVGLPRDADDEPIHIDDLMSYGGHKAFQVKEMRLVDEGQWKVIGDAGTPYNPEQLRHIESDTIEGIMFEAVMRTHCDTLARKDHTDVSDLLERLRDLMDGSDD